MNLDAKIIKNIPKLINDTLGMVDHLIAKLHKQNNWFPGGEEEIKYMGTQDKLQIINNIIDEAAKGSVHHRQILEELKIDPEFKVVMYNALIVGTSYMIMNKTIKPKTSKKKEIK